jgi:hypothetical protein
MVTGTQVGAARAWLGWTLVKLAGKAKISVSTVRRIEAASGEPTISAGLGHTADYQAAALAASAEAIRAAPEGRGSHSSVTTARACQGKADAVTTALMCTKLPLSELATTIMKVTDG